MLFKLKTKVMKSFLLLTFIVTHFAGFCQQNCLITRVIDGDTYKVLLNGKMQTVQSLNIDAPEIGQYFGKEAKENVTALIQGRMVDATVYDKDIYGRHIISIHVDGLRLDSLLIARGWAVYNYKYSLDNRLWALETIAKTNRAGLWKCSNNIPPWIFRKLDKGNKRFYQVCRPLTSLPLQAKQ